MRARPRNQVHRSFVSRARHRGGLPARSCRSGPTPSSRRERQRLRSSNDWPMRPSTPQPKLLRRAGSRWHGDVPRPYGRSLRSLRRLRLGSLFDRHRLTRSTTEAVSPMIWPSPSRMTPHSRTPRPVTMPSTHLRCRPKSAECYRRTGRSPETRVPNDVEPIFLDPKVSDPRRPKALGRTALRPAHSPALTGSRSVHVTHAPDRASPLGIPAGLSTIGDMVDSVGQIPFFVRSLGFPRCRSIPLVRGSHGVGFDATLPHGVNDKPDSLASDPPTRHPRVLIRWSHPQQE